MALILTTCFQSIFRREFSIGSRHMGQSHEDFKVLFISHVSRDCFFFIFAVRNCLIISKRYEIRSK